MARFISFITKTNQLLLFLVLLAGLVAIGSFAYSELSNDNHSSVQVADSTTPATVETVSDVRLLGKSDQTYVLGLCRREVSGSHKSSGLVVPKSKSSFSSGDSTGEIVNIRFITPGKPNANLLKADGLVLQHDLSPALYNHTDLNLLIFRCVTKDTDKNKVLDDNDRIDLYLVSRDGVSAQLVITGASEYKITSDHELVVSKHDDAGLHLLAIDADTLVAKEIDWKN